MKRLRPVLLVLFAGVFLFSACMLARELVRSRRERAVYSALAARVRQAAPPASVEAAPSPWAESGVLRQYDALWQQNNDLAGWLRIQGTGIDYPVMYTPEEPEKYLYRDFHGDQAAGGSLFLGQGGGPDAPLVIVFGHHMRDGSMFGDLDEYRSADYAGEHPVIRLDTLTEEREYEVVAAFRSRVYGVEEQGVFRYYRYADLSDRAAFDDYLARVREAALYDTGVEVSFGDRILVLSTCSYHTENGRFAVVARQRTDEP